MPWRFYVVQTNELRGWLGVLGITYTGEGGNLQGQPQWRRKTMIVGLSAGSSRLGLTGALSPTFGTGATSLAGGVFHESHSCERLAWLVLLVLADMARYLR